MVLEQTAAELERQLTAGGKPKKGGSLGRAIDQAADLTAQLSEMRERLRNADHFIGELERLGSERATLADPTLLEQMRRDLEGAEGDLKQGTEAQAPSREPNLPRPRRRRPSNRQPRKGRPWPTARPASTPLASGRRASSSS